MSIVIIAPESAEFSFAFRSNREAEINVQVEKCFLEAFGSYERLYGMSTSGASVWKCISSLRDRKIR